MTSLIDRLREATENDPELFREAYEVYGQQKGAEWRQRTLLLINDRAFLDAANMFADEGWTFTSSCLGHSDFLCLGEDFHENSAFALGETEANARLAMWLTIMEQAR